ncbi:hypothetical protein PIROE2DRAFT_9678 [Piromyces sp. E2]|nr:hypothetical protein PIROE2DRAFT_9678 [Piromyces sp. E2]|eukprot:OUM63739.1 hypothetical protein PIROE2DRAFT_9678 [Piromyces sp. E2]
MDYQIVNDKFYIVKTLYMNIAKKEKKYEDLNKTEESYNSNDNISKPDKEYNIKENNNSNGKTRKTDNENETKEKKS